MDLFLTLVFVLMTWKWIGCGLILYLSISLVIWRQTGCGLNLVLRVCVGDLEIDSMLIDS